MKKEEIVEELYWEGNDLHIITEKGHYKFIKPWVNKVEFEKPPEEKIPKLEGEEL